MKWDATQVVAIVIGLFTLLGGAIAGWWQHFSMKRTRKAESDKINSDASVTASAALMNGFVLLIGEFKAERAQLTARIDDMEKENRKCNRRIYQLELAMSRKRMEVPPWDDDDRIGEPS